jgi:hypothetical protein
VASFVWTLLADIEKLSRRVANKKLIKPAKINQAIGRLRERYPRVARVCWSWKRFDTWRTGSAGSICNGPNLQRLGINAHAARALSCGTRVRHDTEHSRAQLNGEAALAITDFADPQQSGWIGGIMCKPNSLRPDRPADVFMRLERRSPNGKLDVIAHVDAVGTNGSTVSDNFSPEQSRDGFVGGSQKHRRNRAGLQYATGIEQQEVVGEEDGLRRIVGHQYCGRIEFLLQFQKLLAETGAKRRIKRRERFVK